MTAESRPPPLVTPPSAPELRPLLIAADAAKTADGSGSSESALFSKHPEFLGERTPGISACERGAVTAA